MFVRFPRFFFNPATTMMGVTAVNLAITNAMHGKQKVDAKTSSCPDCKEEQRKEVPSYESPKP